MLTGNSRRWTTGIGWSSPRLCFSTSVTVAENSGPDEYRRSSEESRVLAGIGIFLLLLDKVNRPSAEWELTSATRSSEAVRSWVGSSGAWGVAGEAIVVKSDCREDEEIWSSPSRVGTLQLKSQTSIRPLSEHDRRRRSIRGTGSNWPGVALHHTRKHE